MRRPILNHTEKGALVYDPFLGSGSTLMAADSVERICYGLEISPAYVDPMVQRWQNHIGKKAVLDANGQSTGPIIEDYPGDSGSVAALLGLMIQARGSPRFCPAAYARFTFSVLLSSRLRLSFTESSSNPARFAHFEFI